MNTLWKLSPAMADTFFKPMSIPYNWSRQVAGRVFRITVIKWMPGVKIRLQWHSGRAGGNVAWGYFEPYWLPANRGAWGKMKWPVLNWRICIFLFGYADEPQFGDYFKILKQSWWCVLDTIWVSQCITYKFNYIYIEGEIQDLIVFHQLIVQQNWLAISILS